LRSCNRIRTARRDGSVASLSARASPASRAGRGHCRARHLPRARLAERPGKPVVALQAIREVARLIELQGKFAGEINQATGINIAAGPVPVSLQFAILMALRPFPKARVAVLNALAGISEGPAH
jgi:hypothetical protein